MISVVYAIVIIVACCIGGISGMGGGVIIKPTLDLIGVHSVAEISFFSSVAVFSMSLVSVSRQWKTRREWNLRLFIFVIIGAMFGGGLGGYLLQYGVTHFPAEYVSLWQSGTMIALIVLTLLHSAGRICNKQLRGAIWYVLVGVVLGFFASALGIGGGPINVSLLIFCFSVGLKDATLYSIGIIFFSQFIKIVSLISTGVITTYDTQVLWFVIPAAVIGGLLGAQLNRQLPVEKVKLIFQSVTILVLLMNVSHLIQLLI